jgi:transposase
MKKYIVQLNEVQRSLLTSLISGGKETARSQMHARILLKADQGEGGPAWTDQQICEALEVGHATVERVRKRFVEGGWHEALVRRPQPERPEMRKLAGEQEAYLIALACQGVPEGREHWSLRMLSDKLVELGIVESVSHESVRTTLKKTNSNRGSKSSGAFHQSRMPPLSIIWKMCFRCISRRTMKAGHRSAWMRSANNS